MGTNNPTPRKHPPQVATTPLVPGSYQPVPDELAPDEVLEWKRFVGSMPPDWFTPETRPMLASLCRHVCMSRWIADQLVEVRCGSLNVLSEPPKAPEYGTGNRKPKEPTALDTVDKLLAMHAREVRQIALLMIKLRLTPQVRHLEETAREARATRRDIPSHRPWQDPDDSGRAPTLSQ